MCVCVCGRACVRACVRARARRVCVYVLVIPCGTCKVKKNEKSLLQKDLNYKNEPKVGTNCENFSGPLNKNANNIKRVLLVPCEQVWSS